MSEIVYTPFEAAHLAGTLALLREALHADPVSRSAFARKVLLDPNFDPQGARVALHKGEVVGFGLALARRFPLEDAPSDASRGYITLFAVLPAFQRRGVGGELLKQMEAFLKERERSLVFVSSYAPNYFTPGIDVNAYPSALAFFAKQGYAEIYRPIAMDCNLLPLKTPHWVQEKARLLEQDGVTLETYRAERALPLFAFLKKEFPGDWQRFAREAAVRIELGDSPTRLWVAHREGEVLGYSHHEGERFGPIGVAADERGRGMGQVLMYQTLHAMRDSGLHTAFFLWSDDRTADRIYREAGFRETRRFALLKKEI